MNRYGLFVPVLHADVAKPIRLRMDESDIELVHRVFILGIDPSHEPRLFFVNSVDAIMESLGDGTTDLTLSNPETYEQAQRPSNSLINATIGTRCNTSFPEGCYNLRELPDKSEFLEPTRFTVKDRIAWQDTTNPEVLRYVFGSFPTALLEAELERRRIENEQDAEQDAHELDVREQEQDEYDEHQRRELDRERGRRQ